MKNQYAVKINKYNECQYYNEITNAIKELFIKV